MNVAAVGNASRAAAQGHAARHAARGAASGVGDAADGQRGDDAAITRRSRTHLTSRCASMRRADEVWMCTGTASPLSGLIASTMCLGARLCIA
jgi:hypothetical protein